MAVLVHAIWLSKQRSSFESEHIVQLFPISAGLTVSRTGELHQNHEKPDVLFGAFGVFFDEKTCAYKGCRERGSFL